jgi:hypothetical protein
VTSCPDITPSKNIHYDKDYGIPDFTHRKPKPGTCISWEEKTAGFPQISGDRDIVQRVWEDIDALGNMFIRQCLVSF